MPDSFQSRSTLAVNGKTYTLLRLAAVESRFPQVKLLPFSLKVLLENLLRTENGLSVTAKDIEALAQWNPAAVPDTEIAFTPARVLLQDFTGVPCVVDLAAMRDAMNRLGGDATKINPLQPAELVIDHSVQVDDFANAQAFANNTALEYERNQERYIFLRWGQTAFRNFKVVPPETGIVHQVNLEFLARGVFVNEEGVAYPDTLVGTDSHTTMVNGLGVLGWGVGGIEAEAAMLGQPVSMLIPQVVGFRLFGKLPEGATATDLVLTVTQMLRKKGVVGKFVEFFGEGLAALPLADRATIANMAPEYGATCGIFPVDAETLHYLRTTGRTDEQVALVEAYYREQGMFHTAETPAATYTDVVELDIGSVQPSLAGPSRPQDRVLLNDLKQVFLDALPKLLTTSKVKPLPMAEISRAHGEGTPSQKPLEPTPGASIADIGGAGHEDVSERAAKKLRHGSVVIAAITSCTNTSNPSVMVAAGLLAKKAVEKGLTRKAHVKTSLSPGSKVVTDYFTDAGLLEPLQKLGFDVTGYGCMTCIGNSGPLPEAVSNEIVDSQLVVASVLSGNRNFEGRVHSEVRANFLASPPLVVAFAIAGRVDLDLTKDPVGYTPENEPVFLRDIWPTQAEVNAVIEKSITAEAYKRIYASVFTGDENWQALRVPTGALYAWDADSTYVQNPPYFDGMTMTPDPVTDIIGARVLALLGNSITTDHISPAGAIKETSPAGKYLISKGVAKKDFNSYGARRGNHEVMMRGTFAHPRLKNKLVEGVEGTVTRHMPDGEEMTIYDAAMRYQQEGTPLVIIAGTEYGSGSSRDWAAKGTKLLGVRVVIAESYERIHRSNLIGMGVLALQFKPGQNAESLGLTGEEVYSIKGLADAIRTNFADGRELSVRVQRADGVELAFPAIVRIDTPQEVLYYQHGGILPYVLRQLVAGK